jgi:hypothetical protein
VGDIHGTDEWQQHLLRADDQPGAGLHFRLLEGRQRRALQDRPALQPHLAEKNGYESAQAFFSQHIKEISQATLSRYGAVAREFTEEVCSKYGVMRLTTLRTYAAVADIQPVSGDPGSTPIDVPQTDGGRVVRKLFSECSVEELKLAVKNKRQPSRAPMPTPDAARVELMRESISRYFAKGARVQLKTSVQRGNTLVTIQGVPLAEMERLMEALMDGLMPQPVRAVG